VCLCELGYEGEQCEQCTLPDANWPDCLPCTTDGDCDDGNGCTQDVCTPAGECANLACDEARIVWGAGLWLPPNPELNDPGIFEFPEFGIAVPFYIDGHSVAPHQALPPDSGVIPEIGAGSLFWGDAPDTPVLVPSAPQSSGSITFLFPEPAHTLGPESHYVLVVGGTGAPDGIPEGPLSITCDQPMQTVVALANPDFAPFYDGATIFGNAGVEDGDIVLALPATAGSVTCTFVDEGPIADDHYYGIGLVGFTASVCQGSGESAGCIGDVCGDGVPGLTELCDDGNLDPLDGCSPSCVPEGAAVCEPVVVSSVCQEP